MSPKPVRHIGSIKESSSSQNSSNFKSKINQHKVRDVHMSKGVNWLETTGTATSS